MTALVYLLDEAPIVLDDIWTLEVENDQVLEIVNAKGRLQIDMSEVVKVELSNG